MRAREIPKQEWKEYLDHVSKHMLAIIPEFTTLEVLSADMGLQLETSRERLLGLTYDPKEDAVEFEFSGFVHRVLHPREIRVAETETGQLQSLKVLVEEIDLRAHRGREEIATLRSSPGYRALLEHQS